MKNLSIKIVAVLGCLILGCSHRSSNSTSEEHNGNYSNILLEQLETQSFKQSETPVVFDYLYVDDQMQLSGHMVNEGGIRANLVGGMDQREESWSSIKSLQEKTNLYYLQVRQKFDEGKTGFDSWLSGVRFIKRDHKGQMIYQTELSDLICSLSESEVPGPNRREICPDGKLKMLNNQSDRSFQIMVTEENLVYMILFTYNEFYLIQLDTQGGVNSVTQFNGAPRPMGLFSMRSIEAFLGKDSAFISVSDEAGRLQVFGLNFLSLETRQYEFSSRLDTRIVFIGNSHHILLTDNSRLARVFSIDGVLEEAFEFTLPEDGLNIHTAVMSAEDQWFFAGETDLAQATSGSLTRYSNAIILNVDPYTSKVGYLKIDGPFRDLFQSLKIKDNEIYALLVNGALITHRPPDPHKFTKFTLYRVSFKQKASDEG